MRGPNGHDGFVYMISRIATDLLKRDRRSIPGSVFPFFTAFLDVGFPSIHIPQASDKCSARIAWPQRPYARTENLKMRETSGAASRSSGSKTERGCTSEYQSRGPRFGPFSVCIHLLLCNGQSCGMRRGTCESTERPNHPHKNWRNN